MQNVTDHHRDGRPAAFDRVEDAVAPHARNPGALKAATKTLSRRRRIGLDAEESVLGGPARNADHVRAGVRYTERRVE